MSDRVPPKSTASKQELQTEIARLNKIIQALMNRAERNASVQGSSYNLFQTAITLEGQVRSRTGQLEAALQENEKINRALRESENHYRLLVENSPMCIHEIDKEGKISSMNRSGLNMMGLREEYEVLGYSYLDTVNEDDRDQIGALLDKAYAGEASHFEFHASGSGGQIYKSCFVPIKNKSGRVEKLMGITEDITERKRMERQLTESEALFRAIFDHASVGIELIDPDTLNFIEANPAAYRMLGYTHDELLHMGLADTQVDVDEQELRAYIRQTVRSGGAIFNTRHRCKNGDILDVEVNAQILELSNKRLLVGIWRDITERKRAQEEIEFKNIILQTEQEVSPDAILVVDENAQIISFNQKFVDLWKLPEEIVNARLEAPVLHAVVEQVEDAATFVERVHYLYQHRDEEGREEIRLKDKRILERYSAPIAGVDGKYYGRVWYFHDITERKNTEEQIRNLAFNDALTRLPNRRLLNERLKQAMVTCKRTGLYGTVMFLDLDNFKPLNDSYGHDVGDLLLVEVAHRITGCVREMDTVARFGGDEFVVMMGDLSEDKINSLDYAIMIAEKIRAALAEPYLLKHRQEGVVETLVEYRCTSSIGVVLFNDREGCPEDIIKWADMAMYRAKEARGNTVRFLDASSYQSAV